MTLPPEHKLNFGLLINLASVAMTMLIGLFLAGMWAQARDSRIAELDRRVVLLEAQTLLVVNKLGGIESLVREVQAEQRILHKGQLHNGNGGP